MLEVLISMLALQSDPNEILKYCIKKIEGQEIAYVQTADFNRIASCAEQIRFIKRELNYQDLREFLENNPHYRYPGAGLPNGKIKALDECWGKTRKYHTDKGC